MSGPEQRREKRAPLEIEVNLESENNFYSGITGNVSTGGVFIATYTPPPTGAEVELELALLVPPEGTPVRFQLRGVVLWVRGAQQASDFAPAGCGVRWIELPDVAAKAITRFVDKRDTIFYDDE